MSQQLDINCDSLIEIAPSEWNILLNLYAKKKSESSGYPLISNYIKWKAKEPDLDIQCLSLNGDWQADGTFLMIVHKNRLDKCAEYYARKYIRLHMMLIFFYIFSRLAMEPSEKWCSLIH